MIHSCIPDSSFWSRAAPSSYSRLVQLRARRTVRTVPASPSRLRHAEHASRTRGCLRPPPGGCCRIVAVDRLRLRTDDISSRSQGDCEVDSVLLSARVRFAISAGALGRRHGQRR